MGQKYSLAPDFGGSVDLEIFTLQTAAPSQGTVDIDEIFAPYRQRQAEMQSQINSLTRGRGWESLSGQHGLNWSTFTTYANGRQHSMRYLSGYWYWNVSRVVELAMPKPTHSTWLSAHAAQRAAVHSRVSANYTANGINTPWIPEIYEAYAIDGKFAVYGK